jgi:hypothetical protein
MPPKETRSGKQVGSRREGGSSKTVGPSGGVVKLKSPPKVPVVSNDIPVKELEERRQQMRTQLQQVEIQVIQLAMRPCSMWKLHVA